MCSNYLVMLTDGTFLPCVHYISIQMSPDGAFQPSVRFISFECSYRTTLAQSHGNVRSQPSPLMTVQPSYCCCVKVFLWVLIPSLLGARGNAEEGTWLFNCGPEERLLTTGSAAFFGSQGKKCFAILSGDGGRSWWEGGRGSRKDTISQLSTPAWFAGVSREGFHTWGNNRAEAEDGIKFLHCYPSVSLHQGR